MANAVEVFFERVDLAAGTVRKYRHTLGRLVERHGQEPLAAVGADELTELLEELAGQATGQTWNRHRAALGSLWSYGHRRGWVAFNVIEGVQRRRAVTARRGEQRKRTIPMPTLERLWGIRGTAGRNVVHPLRERTLWRLAYDTAARADELLNLNIEYLDLRDRSAPVVNKGGEVRRVRWTTGTNRLLRELVGGRSRGRCL
ncbi:MAG: site-specific integrase [Actinomycetota bacterium]|nr:site-specific integrase [Actinomycetota bacterium]